MAQLVKQIEFVKTFHRQSNFFLIRIIRDECGKIRVLLSYVYYRKLFLSYY